MRTSIKGFTVAEPMDATTTKAMNERLAELLDEVADLLESQHANEFRTRAWRKAANTVRALASPVRELYTEEGFDGLDRLPNVGSNIGRAIEFYLRTGFIPMLNRLRGEVRPAAVFETIPDIGPELAKRIHDVLHIESLHELQQAARDGRLAKVPGMGPKLSLIHI